VGAGRLQSEDQAVRTRVGVVGLALCIGLSGCSLFGRKGGGGSGSGDKPFLGSSPAPSSSSAPEPTAVTSEPQGPLPGASGLLAGQVIDRSNNHPSKVFIQVVDLQESRPQPAAKIEVESQQGGYFVVQGLKPGHHYRLIARARDGERLLSGTTITMPPNPRVSILVSEEYTTPNTPAVPDNPAIPGRSSGPGGAPDGGAALDAPVKPQPGETPAVPRSRDNGTPSNPTGVGGWPPQGAAPPNPAQIAQGNGTERDNGLNGWGRIPPAPPASIGQTPGTPLPPLPGRDPPASPTWGPAGGPPTPRIDPVGPPPQPPNVPTQVPSCVVVGRQLHNFALYDLEGKVWEFRRNRTGKLVLLDFWFTGCMPCLLATPHLVELQHRYGQYGLEIIGIAYEKGTVAEQVMRIRGVRGRYGVTYQTLLGDGPNCPVKHNLQVRVFPTLFLLDETGQIVWSSGDDGLDDYAQRDLEGEIRRRLNVR
jgi:thiol-disulfide isomerase/thioredoxin